MESLLSIVKNLTKAEVKLVHHFYKLHENADNHKRGIFFNYLLKTTNCDDDKASKEMGYSSCGSSFLNLKQRVKSDVLCILLMQECSAKFSTPYAQAIFECRRSLMQGEILLGRGVYEEAFELLTRAFKAATKYQLYAEQLQIQDILRNNSALKGNVGSFNKAKKSISESYRRLGELMDAKNKHYEITSPRLMEVRSLKEYTEKGKITISELGQISDASSCSRIKLYNDLAAINYFSSTLEFDKAEKHALQLMNAVETDHIVISKSNQAGANMELANIYLNTAQYDKAIMYASKAVELFKPGMINQLHAYINLFFAYFRNNNLKEASYILSIAQKHRLITSHQHPQMKSRIHLLRAAVLFKEGDFEKSSSTLHRNAEICRDNEGWIPGYYMLDLLILLEKKSTDLVAYKLEAFRKMLHRHGLDKQEMRTATITRIIKSLVKEDCNFLRIIPSSREAILKLTEAKEGYYWNPSGYEVIRFDDWILGKVG